LFSDQKQIRSALYFVVCIRVGFDFWCLSSTRSKSVVACPNLVLSAIVGAPEFGFLGLSFEALPLPVAPFKAN
jgi:hypothetical protein